MYHYEDKAAFRCSVAPECSRASIQIGWNRFPARVTEVARDGFTVVIPSKASRKISQGAKLRLNYGDELWVVSLKSRNLSSDGRIELKVRREKDLTPHDYRGSQGLTGVHNSISLRAADPALSIGALAGIILILLVCPGYGDELGTSSFLTELIGETLQSIWSAITGT